MNRYSLLIVGLAFSTASMADINSYLPKPDQRPSIERPMPYIPPAPPAPWIRVAPTSPDSVLILGGKNDTNGYVHVAPNSVQVGISTPLGH